MAQTITFNDIDVELTIDTSTGTNDLLVTGVEGQKVVAALRELKKNIPTLKKVSYDIPGGGIVGRIGIRTSTDDVLLQRLLYLNFSDLTIPSPNFYYEFINGSWTEQEVAFVDDIKDALLVFNDTHTLTNVVGQSYPVGFSGHATLSDNLIAYYKIDEASGTRMNSLLQNNLTPSGSITTMAGLIDLAVVSSASSFLTCTSGIVNPVTDLTVSGWLNPISPDGAVTSSMVTCVGPGPVPWIISYLPATNQIRVTLFNTVSTSVIADSTSLLSNDMFNHVVVIIDTSAQTIEVVVNNSAPDVSAVLAGTIKTDATSFRVANVGPAGQPIAVDEIGIWNRRLTSSEITSLYNGGVGVTY